MKIHFYLTIFLLTISQSLLAKVDVSIDRDPVVMDESFQLIFESDEQIDGQPDFNTLKKSLTIINSSNRSSTQIINGKITHKQQWVLTALANKAGVIEIPSIKFDKTYSPAVKLRVINAKTKSQRITDDVYLETSLSTDSPYVQAQVVLTIKLYRAIATSNSSLSDPSISGGQAVIEKLGEDKSYEQRNQGRVYNVVERQYVIFPQNSGKLNVEPIVFQGQTGNAGFFGRDPFGPPAQTIVKRSESLTLDVKPIPASFTGSTWLPAENISIKETWSVSPEKLTAGDAVTRIIILEATGLAASQLPQLSSGLPNSFKQYPDQPEFEEIQVNQSVVGVRREKMAVIPTVDGSYLLPAIQMPWWNTKKDQQEIAELPERKIIVNPLANTPVKTDLTDEAKASESELELGSSVISKESQTLKQQGFWQWLAVVIFVLWLLTLFAWYRSSKHIHSENKHSKQNHANKLKQVVIQAANQNDAKAVREALVKWGQANWPDEVINSTHQLKTKMNTELQKELDLIDASLYGKTKNNWQGEQFSQLFKAQKFNVGNKIESERKLEPLYKT